MLRRRSARARGYDRLGDLLVSPPAKAAAAVGREENGVAALRSIRCSPRRCPYLKTPVASSVALVVAALLVLTGALFLNGLVGSVRPAHIAAGVAESHADASGATRLRRGKRSKQKAVTSSFHLERPVGAESSHDEFHVSSWVWLSQEERERGFSLRHSAPGGLLAEVAVLSDDECAEGWQGDSCLECAPGFHGDFCVATKPQVDIYSFQMPVPATAEVRLRDYLPPDPRPLVRGSAVFSAGVSVARSNAAGA
jgi:hypothetical protein